MSDRVRKSLKRLMQTQIKSGSLTASVETVNEAQRSCVVQPVDGGAKIFGVRFYSAIGTNGKGIIAVPAKDSEVIVSFIDNVQQAAYISMYGKIDKFILITEQGGIVELQGDDFGGLVKVAELTEKLNNMENDINTLKQAFNSWIVVPNDGGAALKVSASSWAGEALTPTEQNEIENTKVKHGGI